MNGRPSLGTLALYFLRLGLTGFGGPAALANYIRRDLVERYHWLDDDEYNEGLAIATACPGPLAYKLGIYCGFVTQAAAGALVVAVSFAAAPFLIVVGVAAFYTRFGSTIELRAIFYGIGPVVIAIILRSCWDLGRKMLGREWLAYVFAAVACAITVTLQQELIALFLAAGLIGIFAFYRPSPAAGPAPRALPNDTVLPTALTLSSAYQSVAVPNIFWFFFKAGLLVFGSGLVIVPFLKAYVVDQYHWISNRAFLDAVAIGIVSPGPVVITATFVGYLTHRLPGAAAATLGIFTPSLFFVLVGTPILRRYRQNARLQGFIRGITVAVVGVLLGTSYLVARSTIHDGLGLIILIGALAALWSRRRLAEPLLVAAGGVIGLAAVLLVGVKP